MSGTHDQKPGTFRWRRVAQLSIIASVLLVAGALVPLITHSIDDSISKDDSGEPDLQAVLTEQGWSFGMGDNAEDELSLVPFSEITFERGPCFGPCPVYQMILYSSGKAKLTRNHWTPDASADYVGEISPFHFARLSQLAEIAQGSVKEDRFAGAWTDDYEATIHARGSSRDWKVSDYGAVAPPIVWALETALHSTYEDIKWKSP